MNKLTQLAIELETLGQEELKLFFEERELWKRQSENKTKQQAILERMEKELKYSTL